MASWGSYVFELCRINANQGLTAEIDWNYTSWSRRCRKILIGLVVRGAKTVVVRGKNRILTRNRKKPEMTVPISPQRLGLFFLLCRSIRALPFALASIPAPILNHKSSPL